MKKILVGIILLFLVGCSSKEIKDINGNTMNDESFDIYSLELKDAITVLDQSVDEGDIVQNTIDIIGMCCDQMSLLIQSYQDGNDNEFKASAKELNKNCNKLLDITSEKNKILKEKIESSPFEEYSRSLKRSLDVFVSITDDMKNVKDVDDYEFNFDRVDLLFDEHINTFLEYSQNLTYK